MSIFQCTYVPKVLLKATLVRIEVIDIILPEEVLDLEVRRGDRLAEV